MIPLQLKINAAIVGLTRENAATEAQLKRVQTLEHELALDRPTRTEFEAKAALKEYVVLDLQESQAKARSLFEEVGDLRIQLALQKGEEVDVSLLRIDLLKRLEESATEVV